MKPKPFRKKEGIAAAFRDIYSNANQYGETEISIDTNGFVAIDNFKKLIDYRKGVVVAATVRKRIYIYGENLVIVSCGKNSAVCKGDISRVEMYESEE